VQQEAVSWTNDGKYDPWDFATAYRLPFEQEHFSVEGAFAWSIIERHPLEYLGNSIPDVLNVWLAPLYFYPPYGPLTGAQTPASSNGTMAVPGFTAYQELSGLVSSRYEPGWINVLLAISTYEQYSYLLLPILVCAFAIYAARRPKNVEGIVLLALCLAVAGAVVVTALGGYSEFYRIRFPVDWGMIVLCTVAIAECLSRVGVLPHKSRYETDRFEPTIRLEASAISRTMEWAERGRQAAEADSPVRDLRLHPEVEDVTGELNQVAADQTLRDTLYSMSQTPPQMPDLPTNVEQQPTEKLPNTETLDSTSQRLRSAFGWRPYSPAGTATDPWRRK
jgi:hypothetical protein